MDFTPIVYDLPSILYIHFFQVLNFFVGLVIPAHTKHLAKKKSNKICSTSVHYKVIPYPLCVLYSPLARVSIPPPPPPLPPNDERRSHNDATAGAQPIWHCGAYTAAGIYLIYFI